MDNTTMGGNAPFPPELLARLQELAKEYKTIRAQKVAEGVLDNTKTQMPNPTELQAKLKQYQTTLLPKLKLLDSLSPPSFSDEEKAFLKQLHQECQTFLGAFPKLNELLKTKLQSLFSPAQTAVKIFENWQNGLIKKEGGGDSVYAGPSKSGAGNQAKAPITRTKQKPIDEDYWTKVKTKFDTLETALKDKKDCSDLEDLFIDASSLFLHEYEKNREKEEFTWKIMAPIERAGAVEKWDNNKKEYDAKMAALIKDLKKVCPDAVDCPPSANESALITAQQELQDALEDVTPILSQKELTETDILTIEIYNAAYEKYEGLYKSVQEEQKVMTNEHCKAQLKTRLSYKYKIKTPQNEDPKEVINPKLPDTNCLKGVDFSLPQKLAEAKAKVDATETKILADKRLYQGTLMYTAQEWAEYQDFLSLLEQTKQSLAILEKCTSVNPSVISNYKAATTLGDTTKNSPQKRQQFSDKDIKTTTKEAEELSKRIAEIERQEALQREKAKVIESQFKPMTFFFKMDSPNLDYTDDFNNPLFRQAMECLKHNPRLYVEITIWTPERSGTIVNYQSYDYSKLIKIRQDFITENIHWLSGTKAPIRFMEPTFHNGAKEGFTFSLKAF